MTKSVTITARVAPSLAKKLATYAKVAKRTKSQAIEMILDRHIDHEKAVVEAILAGLASAERGELYTTEEVFGALKAKSERRRRALRRKAA